MPKFLNPKHSKHQHKSQFKILALTAYVKWQELTLDGTVAVVMTSTFKADGRGTKRW